VEFALEITGAFAIAVVPEDTLYVGLEVAAEVVGRNTVVAAASVGPAAVSDNTMVSALQEVAVARLVALGLASREG